MKKTGQKEIDIKLPCGYSERDLNLAVRKQIRIQDFSYKIIRKSLDSRRKDRIHWQIRVLVSSPLLKLPSHDTDCRPVTPLHPRKRQTGKRAVIAGTGPAGIFAALFLQQSGVQVTLLERGQPVEQRKKDIMNLEEKGIFTPDSNYSFGEGGAGTFSDGKLTSRSKHIKREKQYILEEFVRQGAPEEILYLTHPHIGSDNLVRIAANMRKTFQKAGGDILFGCTMTDLDIKDGKVRSVIAEGNDHNCDFAVLATGHSSFDSYRMLIRKGIAFRPKNFALGFRMEHPQELINTIQWGCPALPGVKAAEYRLTSGKAPLPVYTFCMCPGGKVVPAAAYKDQNIVNGMSYYERDGRFANAALVAGISLEKLMGRKIGPLESLDWLESLEKSFFETASGYKAPAMAIRDFLGRKQNIPLKESSYQPGLIPWNLEELIPLAVAESLRTGLEDICRRLPEFDRGQLLGLESKTSSPVQVVRDRGSGLTEGTENLFICGEASGYTGGIISSASDGLKAALSIMASL